MINNILMIILGFVLLVVGADMLVKGASNISKKFHIPEMLIGLTIVAIGTSAPELIITITSTQSSSTDLIIGNAIGSNLCNLLFILGLMAVIRPVKIDKEARIFHIPMAFLASTVILLMGLGILGNSTQYINQIEGFFLIILFIVYFSYPIIKEFEDIINSYKKEKLERQNSSNKDSKKEKINIPFSLLLIVVGVFLLKYGGDFVVDSATNIALYFNISERVIGLTVVAIGTALPELVTSIFAVIRKDTDIAVGNLVGSCVLNLFLILGIGAMITPLEFTPDFIQNLILLCSMTIVLWLFNFMGKRDTITRPKGLVLLGVFALYMVSLFV
mgnify:FL=1